MYSQGQSPREYINYGKGTNPYTNRSLVLLTFTVMHSTCGLWHQIQSTAMTNIRVAMVAYTPQSVMS